MNGRVGHARRPGRLWIVLSGVAAWFAPLLVPGGLSLVAQNSPWVLYFLSLPVLFVLLLAVAARGAFGLWRARERPGSGDPRHRAYLLAGCLGMALCGLGLGPVGNLPRPMPPGSPPARFDPSVWKDPGSSRLVPRDVTPRQKMLADVVDRLLPGSTRAGIETALGPSEESFYSEGQDLVYELGPVPDFFFAADSEWLLLFFDDDGRYLRHAIHTN